MDDFSEMQARFEEMVKALHDDGSTPKGTEVLTKKVSELRPHPENTAIYGEHADPDLTKSIRDLGVLEPLLVTPDGVIVSGFRRWKAAGEAGLPAVPVVVLPFTDELEILEALIHANKQRVKTRSQLAVEAARLREVERERARKRQQATQMAGRDAEGKHLRSSVVDNLPPPSEGGKARDKVGKALGVSGKKADRLADVGEGILKYQQAGQTEKAEALKATLDARGLNAALRELHGRDAPAAGKVTGVDVGTQQASVAPQEGTYDVLVVDSAWATRDDVEEVPVSTVAAADSVLLLWTPPERLDRALELLRVWGFEYAGSLYLRGPKGGGSVVEQGLVGVRGEAKSPFHGTDNLVAEKVSVHKQVAGGRRGMLFQSGDSGGVEHAGWTVLPDTQEGWARAFGKTDA